ncbi:MAG: tRNA preQ1(34) S-adenosylmethionine ribosyltransferase-isomerase QueA [Deltaproteobacteria bacterium]|nr:tRNA preQ1(34) S-adenosylmethionine ribosyltransferase-isomerase QueA [Deltaproteobacteria bacterium]MBW2362525.1 tRNA preQ1(34) S-adenosylmethionine ribosyltransferase-isomerase QueA [Deltaproteobacteria bacterium]
MRDDFSEEGTSSTIGGELDYELPSECIAQTAVEPRDAARLLGLGRTSGEIRHGQVSDLPDWLRPGDLLVGNVTRVEPARLRGRKASGGKAEALLLSAAKGGGYRALVRCSGRLRVGLELVFEREDRNCTARVEAVGERGEAVLAFDLAEGESPYAFGETPLPPYIRRAAADARDPARYQTVYARAPGSVAAPTAGLHLTRDLLARLAQAEIDWAEVILHVGPGTFRPISKENLEEGELHAEPYELSEATAQAIEATRRRRGRVIAVGTTSCRVLESCAREDGRVDAGAGETRLFLRPGSRFRVVDGLLTNFHLPRSSLLLLVAAFAGRAHVLRAYTEAIEAGYRFYSYGDAMLIQ